jgi:prepilin-type N-terminal cleavage/methylation domain-containing protein
MVEIQTGLIVRTRSMNRNQTGFSLLELMIVIGLTSVVVAGITVAIMGVFNMDARTRNDMTAVYQVRQAGKLVRYDVLQAQSVSALGTEGFPLILTWTDWSAGDSHEVIYTLGDMPSGEFKRLLRSESINDGVPTVKPVAEYIDPDGTSCDWDEVDRVLDFTVTATVGGQSETREEHVQPRSGS